MPTEGVGTCEKKPIWLERQGRGRQYPAIEGRVAVEVSVNCAEKTSYFRIVCAEIADFGFSAKLILLAGRSSESSMLRFPAPLSILACLTLSSLFRLC